MDILDLLYKLSVTGILLGLSLWLLGLLLNYFDITGMLSVVACFIVVISALLFVILFLIEYWRY